MISLLAVLSVAFLLRIIPRIVFNIPLNSDTWFHLTYAEEIRRNNRKIPSEFNKYLLNNEVVYPYLFHLIISLLSFKDNIRLEKYYSGIIDTIFVLFSYYYTSVITNDYNTALNVAILVTMSTTLLKVTSGPRAYQGTPRVLGELLIFSTLASLHFYFLSLNYIWFLISILAGSLSLLCSKFSFQVLLLFLPIISFFYDSVKPLLLINFIIITAVIISKDKYLKILVGHFNHLNNYATVLKKQWVKIKCQNSYHDFKQLIKNILSLNVVGSFKIINSRITYLNIIYKSPEILLFISFIYVYGFNSNFDNFLQGWAFSGIIYFIIVSTYSFKFLGEAERYIEYSIFPILLLISMYSSDFFINCIIVFFLFLYLLNIIKLSRKNIYDSKFQKNLLDCCHFLKENFSDSDCLLPILSKVTFHQGALLTGMKILATTQYDRNKFGKDNWDKLYEFGFPIFTNDFDWLHKTYGINVIIGYKPYMKEVQNETNVNYNFDGFEQVFDRNEFVIYKRE